MMPPTRSSPMKANVEPKARPISTPSGSGPLSSLRLSKLPFSSLVELKFSGSAAAVIRSKSLPLS